MKHLIYALGLSVFMACTTVLDTEAGQQDRWYTESAWTTYDSAASNTVLASVERMDVNVALDRVYVQTDHNPVRVAAYTLAGAFIAITNTAHNNAQHLRVGPDGTVYAIANDTMSIFTPDLVLSNTVVFTNDAGTILSDPDGFGILSNGDLVMGRNGRVRVYDRHMQLKDNWTGSTNAVASMLADIRYMAVDPYDMIYIVEGSSQDLKVYDAAGEFKYRITAPYFHSATAVGRDLTLYGKTATTVYAYKENGAAVLSGLALRLPGARSTTASAKDIALVNDYRVAVLGRANAPHPNSVYFLRRSAYILQPKPTEFMPLPTVLSIAQRPDAPVLEIDYVVFDDDDDTVEVQALAFLDTGSFPANVVRVETLIDGTDLNVGPGVATSTLHRLSWDIGADLPTNVVNVSVEILVRDSNPMLAFDFVTIPSNGPDPELTISRVTVEDSDLRALWYWLLATGDPGITIIGREIKGTAAAGPTYENQRLVNDTDTYHLGAEYLFEKLGVRRATQAEWTRAREGSTPGTVNRINPLFDINGRPNDVNEYGIETENYSESGSNGSAWYVVPTTLPLP